MEDLLWPLMLGMVRCVFVALALACAYFIRCFAVLNYGKVIHEFDPWFNYRAAEYLAEHGAQKFFTWFDHTAWYPLGRPVGTTIYPGMQFIAVWIWEALKHFNMEMSLNDVCVYVPAWFGVVASAFLGLLTLECTGCVDSAIASAIIMAVIPAHLMRSVAGGFDNECVAISALCATFFFWCRSLRSPSSWPWGVIAGLSYFGMVASWGGYVYVLNVIGAHCGVLILAGRYSSGLHRAYTLFFVVGTALAIQIPVVGWTPLRSLEQIGPLAVFGWIQLLEFCNVARRMQRMDEKRFQAFRQQVFFITFAVIAVIVAALFNIGYFAPLSSRVRGLFVQHTRTGNPLVDSVAEHQRTSPRAYWQYLHYTCYFGLVGFAMLLGRRTDASIFLLLFSAFTYYFSAKMNRLILLMGPVCAALGGKGFAGLLHWAIWEIRNMVNELFDAVLDARPADVKETEEAAKANAKAKAKANAKAEAAKAKAKAKESQGELAGILEELSEPILEVWNEGTGIRRCGAIAAILLMFYMKVEFSVYCLRAAESLSQPSIMYKNKKGEMIDDYREAYWWLRDNTPEDSRVMAWWDYGYQISGVANRTTIADGNTWNHEHIATLGRCLTSPEETAHGMIRHLADYVLIWAGGGGDDLAKSPHMARIANSVYTDLCPGDPMCSSFGFHSKGQPTEMMRSSLLWQLHGHNIRENVTANPALFQEAYTSSHGLVRIFSVVNISQESRDWASDKANWRCDAPGSWYCEGSYPPALAEVIAKRKAFKQLEDFNSASKDEEAEEYHRAYLERMATKAKPSA